MSLAYTFLLRIPKKKEACAAADAKQGNLIYLWLSLHSLCCSFINKNVNEIYLGFFIFIFI